MEVNTKILICGENREERKNLTDGLTKLGYRFIDQAENGDDAIALLESNSYDVAIVDLWISGIDGIDIGQLETSKETRDPSDFCIVILKRMMGL